jgi:AraC family transcriptional regulator
VAETHADATWFRSARVARYVAASSMASHRHDDASLCLVVGGRYEEHIRGRGVEHAAGHLLFCPAFEPHAQRFSADGALKILIEPAPAALDYLDRRLALPEAPYSQSTGLAALGGRLLRELLEADAFSPVVVQGLLFEMLGLFARGTAADSCRAPAWLRTAEDFIEAHADAKFSLAELARVLGRHPVHVAREFRRVHRQTVGDYVRGLRVRRAAALLSSGRRPLGEIALACGFCDQAHLTRSFKAVFKMTPGAFRRGVR